MKRPQTDATITARDGRNVAYATYGAADGHPVVFCHGIGHSRLGRHPSDDTTASLGVRLIVVDRPGCGRSDPAPGRRLTDWYEDVSDLADDLGIDRFGLLGWSGGGPYAAACLHALSDRVTRTAIVAGLGPVREPTMLAGVAPPARLMFEVLQRSELIAQLSVAWMPTMLRLDPNRFIDLLWAHAPARDKAILRVPEIRSMMIASYQEGSRQGMQAVVSDLAVSVRPWGAWIEEVRGRVRLWYGDADRLATPNMGKHLADIIPDACLTIWPHQGHLVVWDAWDEIMAYLAEPKPDAH